MKTKEKFTNVEVLGAENLFNIAFEDEFGTNPNEAFFVCGGMLNSESDANGYPLYINDNHLSHLLILENGILIAVCYDEEDSEVYYEVTYNNGFMEIEKWE